MRNVDFEAAEHRLVYTVTDAEILIAGCRYHYH